MEGTYVSSLNEEYVTNPDDDSTVCSLALALWQPATLSHIVRNVVHADRTD